MTWCCPIQSCQVAGPAAAAVRVCTVDVSVAVVAVINDAWQHDIASKAGIGLSAARQSLPWVDLLLLPVMSHLLHTVWPVLAA